MNKQNNISEKKEIDPVKFTWTDFVRAILYLFGEKKKPYLFSLLVVLILNLDVVVPPLVIGKIVDFFVGYTKGESLNTLYYYAAFLAVFLSLVHFVRLSVIQKYFRMSNDLARDIRVNGFEKLLEQSLIKHGDENTGAKAQKIQGGIDKFRAFTEALNDRILPTIATTVGVFSVFLYLNYLYNVFLISYIVLFIIILRFYRKKHATLSHEKNIAMEKSSGTFIEGLNNTLTIKSSGAEQNFKSSVAKKEEIRNHFDQEILRVRVNQWKVFQIFNGIYFGLFLILIGKDVAMGLISIGSIAIIFAYLEKTTEAAGKVLGMYSYLIDIRTTIARMMTIFWSDDAKDSGTRTFPKTWESINVVNGNYAYQGDQKDAELNISNINLTINKNQKIGIIGKTGSGKSTLAKLLIGLYPLQSGELKIGNVKFASIKREEIFKHMAIVLQESEMFNISLKENITLFGNYDEELFNRAIKIAQLEEVVAKLAEGFETLIGEKGYHMSGGERQRVGIARAIYKNPEIIIFDEATSSLDVNTEKKIQQAISKELKEKTIIIVAHRTNTLEDVDMIYEISAGKIIKTGSYGEFFGVKSMKR